MFVPFQSTVSSSGRTYSDRAGFFVFFAFVCVSTSLIGPRSAFAELPGCEQIERLFGIGWGDGYHGCRGSGRRIGADLPPKTFAEQYGPKKGGCLHGGCGEIYPPNAVCCPPCGCGVLGCGGRGCCEGCDGCDAAPPGYHGGPMHAGGAATMYRTPRGSVPPSPYIPGPAVRSRPAVPTPMDSVRGTPPVPPGTVGVEQEQSSPSDSIPVPPPPVPRRLPDFTPPKPASGSPEAIQLAPPDSLSIPPPSDPERSDGDAIEARFLPNQPGLIGGEGSSSRPPRIAEIPGTKPRYDWNPIRQPD